MRQGVAGFVVALLAPVIAIAASAPPPPPHQATSLPHDVPFDISRGPFAPLYFSIDGLWSGHAEVGAGTRPFGVCWQGGASPYEVRLTDPSGAQVFDRRDIATTQLLVTQPTAVQLAPGEYTLSLIDDRTIERDERFTVVDPSKVPARPADPLAHATSVAGAPDGVFAFEAYLETLQLPGHAGGGAALADKLCHRASG